MPNIASVLKEEIARIARKEIRVATDQLAKSSARYRSDIAALKRTIADLERKLAKLSKTGAGMAKAAEKPDDEESGAIRFSAKSMVSQRKRLGLSAADMGVLLGVSGQTVYKWEEGEVRPRKSHFAAIAKVRTMGRKEAQAALEADR